MIKKYTYEELFFKYSSLSLLKTIKSNKKVTYNQLTGIILGRKTRDIEVLEKLMDLLDDVCGFDTRVVCIEYIDRMEEIKRKDKSITKVEYIDEHPKNKFTNLEDLFKHLGVVVSVDERQYYKYTLKENKNETNN